MNKIKGSPFFSRIRKIDPTILSLTIGHGFTDWYLGTLTVIIPYLAIDMGLNYSQVGFLMGWNSFSSFFVNLPGGFIVDTIGQTRLLLGLALLLTGLPYMCLAFAVNYLTAMIVVTFTGIGANLWHPAAFSFLAKRYPDRKGFAMAVHILGGNLGTTLAPLALGFALTYTAWRHVLVLNFLPGLIMTIVLWKLLAKTGDVMAKAKGKQLSVAQYWTAAKTMFRNRHILLLCVLAGMRTMTQSGLFTFLPLYLVHDLKYSPALLGIYLTVIRGVGTLAAPVMGKISDSRGRRPVLTMGLTVTSLLLVALVVLKLHYLFIAVLAILCFFLFSLSPVMLAWMTDLAPKNMEGTTVSALFGIQSLFAGLAPPACGLIADRYGLLYTFYFLAATVFAANFLVYLIPEKAVEEEAALAS